MNEMITTTEAAAIIGCRPASVKNLCLRGKLPGAEKRGRDWFIPRASAESYTPGPQGFAVTPYRGGRKPGTKVKKKGKEKEE